jgi:ribosomal protein S18 acetylase RimI-like enzyme
MQKEKPLVQIVPECAEDVEGVAHVRYQTWLATYPSEISGVTREDIELRFANAFSEENIQKRKVFLENLGKNELNLVAKENGRVVAFCSVVKEDEMNRLRAIYILPEHQRKGIGSCLWEEARKFFDPQKPTWVEVVDYNEGAINFYKSKGFVATGNRRQDERFRMPSGAIFTEIEMIRPAERLGEK